MENSETKYEANELWTQNKCLRNPVLCSIIETDMGVSCLDGTGNVRCSKHILAEWIWLHNGMIDRESRGGGGVRHSSATPLYCHSHQRRLILSRARRYLEEFSWLFGNGTPSLFTTNSPDCSKISLPVCFLFSPRLFVLTSQFLEWCGIHINQRCHSSTIVWVMVWITSHMELWYASLFPLDPSLLSPLFVKQKRKKKKRKKPWLLLNSYSMAWFEYSCNTHQEIIFSF